MSIPPIRFSGKHYLLSAAPATQDNIQQVEKKLIPAMTNGLERVIQTWTRGHADIERLENGIKATLAGHLLVRIIVGLLLDGGKVGVYKEITGQPGAVDFFDRVEEEEAEQLNTTLEMSYRFESDKPAAEPTASPPPEADRKKYQ